MVFGLFQIAQRLVSFFPALSFFLCVLLSLFLYWRYLVGDHFIYISALPPLFKTNRVRARDLDIGLKHWRFGFWFLLVFLLVSLYLFSMIYILCCRRLCGYIIHKGGFSKA